MGRRGKLPSNATANSTRRAKHEREAAAMAKLAPVEVDVCPSGMSAAAKALYHEVLDELVNRKIANRLHTIQLALLAERVNTWALACAASKRAKGAAERRRCQSAQGIAGDRLQKTLHECGLTPTAQRGLVFIDDEGDDADGFFPAT